jgi:protein-disulfide isomerase
MMIRTRCFLLGMTLAFMGASQAPAQVLDYSGRVYVDGGKFNGKGFFVFSIQDTNGEILWASGDFPQAGATRNPVAAWQIMVKDGIYQKRLGDTAAGMPAIDTARVLASKDPFLRVWFHDGSSRGWQIAGDTPIKPALAANQSAAAGSGGAISTAQADAILRELRDLRTLVQKQQPVPKPPTPAAPRIVTVAMGDSPSLGQADAPVVLVEFTDFQCPYCKRAHDGVLAELKKKYVDSGKVRLVSRNLPLPFHPNAEPAALAALCAGEQGQFWAMRDRLFDNTEALSQQDFLKAAEELKLNIQAFTACLDTKHPAPRIANDKQDAAEAGITGTPSFVIGRATGDKVTGLLMIGAKSTAVFEAEIEKLLSTP